MMSKKLLLAGAALALVTGGAQAKDLKTIGISLGSLGNPFFIALSKGAEFEPRKPTRTSSCSRDNVNEYKGWTSDRGEN